MPDFCSILLRGSLILGSFIPKCKLVPAHRCLALGLPSLCTFSRMEILLNLPLSVMPFPLLFVVVSTTACDLYREFTIFVNVQQKNVFVALTPYPDLQSGWGDQSCVAFWMLLLLYEIDLLSTLHLLLMCSNSLCPLFQVYLLTTNQTCLRSV